MADDDPKMTIPAREPISFRLTGEGDLWIVFQAVFGSLEEVPIPMGFLIPQARLRDLRAFLATNETTQETLSAKRPKPGAH